MSHNAHQQLTHFTPVELPNGGREGIGGTGYSSRPGQAEEQGTEETGGLLPILGQVEKELGRKARLWGRERWEGGSH